MRINYLNTYTNITPLAKKSFGSADDINLQYIYDTKLHILPPRMQKEVSNIVKKRRCKMPTLMDLHLQIYEKLNTCKTLEEAKNIYPEFKEIVEANKVIKKSSVNIKAIKEKMPLEEFSLYVLKERWGKLKTLNEIADDFGMKSRNSLGWVLDKIKLPDFNSNYQTLLRNSDPKYNAITSQKTKNYNQKHPERMITHNRILSQRPEIIEKNRDLAEKMWERMPELKLAMSEFKRKNPDISQKDFSQAFWDAHPEYKIKISEIRKEIGYERRCDDIKNKNLSKK